MSSRQSIYHQTALKSKLSLASISASEFLGLCLTALLPLNRYSPNLNHRSLVGLPLDPPLLSVPQKELQFDSPPLCPLLWIALAKHITMAMTDLLPGSFWFSLS